MPQNRYTNTSPLLHDKAEKKTIYIFTCIPTLLGNLTDEILEQSAGAF